MQLQANGEPEGKGFSLHSSHTPAQFLRIDVTQPESFLIIAKFSFNVQGKPPNGNLTRLMRIMSSLKVGVLRPLRALRLYPLLSVFSSWCLPCYTLCRVGLVTWGGLEEGFALKRIQLEQLGELLSGGRPSGCPLQHIHTLL